MTRSRVIALPNKEHEAILTMTSSWRHLQGGKGKGSTGRGRDREGKETGQGKGREEKRREANDIK